MNRRVILAALLSALLLTAIWWSPSGVMRASGPAVATGALGVTEPALQGQSGRPIRALPGLRNITVWVETLRGPTAFTLGVNGSEFTSRLSDPLGPSNKDFFGAPGGET